MNFVHPVVNGKMFSGQIALKMGRDRSFRDRGIGRCIKPLNVMDTNVSIAVQKHSSRHIIRFRYQKMETLFRKIS